MSTLVGPSDVERYGWPGVSADELAASCAPIARRIARANVSSVAFVPAEATSVAGASPAPLLCAIAEALLGFIPGEVGIVDAWPTWRWGEAMDRESRSIYRRRSLAPRISELAPLPCGDAQAAAVALRAALETRPRELGVTLVNLAGYADPGVVPAAAELHDGVVLLAARRRTRRAGLDRLARSLPPEKNLGTVLVG